MSDTLPAPRPSLHEAETLPSSFPAASRMLEFALEEPDPFPSPKSCPVEIVDDAAATLDEVPAGLLRELAPPPPERPGGAWRCMCGTECGPSLIICPSCAMSLHDQPPVFSMTCEGCGHVAIVDAPPRDNVFRCGECKQRTAYGTLVGRWVVEPGPDPRFVQVRITRGAITTTMHVDALHGCDIARDLLSLCLPSGG